METEAKISQLETESIELTAEVTRLKTKESELQSLLNAQRSTEKGYTMLRTCREVLARMDDPIISMTLLTFPLIFKCF